METPDAPRKQRSPWFYVLLGCGGLGGLMCLGTAVVFLLMGKACNDVRAGITDPEQRRENALKQLGGLPTGYTVVASMSVYVMQTTVLTDRAPLDDGGFSFEGDGRQFTYFRVMSNANNQPARDYLSGKSSDITALQRTGVNVSLKDTLKRGQLTIDGRRFSYLSGRSDGDVATGPALHSFILFECPGEELRVGVWTQADPDPKADADAVDVTGSVADEAQLIPFLKPMDPCGR